MPDTIRVLIIDDHPMVRAGLAAIIVPEADMVVVASASNGRAGVELYRSHQPDIALMDLKMPGMGGVEAIHTIRLKENP
jgi:two-component system, NarL family, response regulator